MGQYWQVISPSRREKLGSPCTLQKHLTDGSRPSLVQLLAVPRAFKTTDDTTKEHHPHSDGDITASEPKRRNPTYSTDTTSSVFENTCGLLRIPIELLDAVYQHLDIEDMFFLGIQSQYFWIVALRHIWARCTYSCGSWAGQRIVCVGEYGKRMDVPPNTFSESEKEELRNGLSNDELDKEDWDDPHYTGPINLYMLASTRYRNVRAWSDVASTLIDGAATLGEWSRLPEVFQSRIRDDLARCSLSNLYPEDQPWILRNLTTHEFVCSEINPRMRGYTVRPSIDYMGFGEAVWSRICWRADGCWPMDKPVGPSRGVWVGHRFDITTLDRHEQDSLTATGWKDVSGEVMDEVGKIWFKVTRRNWRS